MYRWPVTQTVRCEEPSVGETVPVHLIRCHGFGNQFLIAFTDEVPASGPELARWSCEPIAGIGADGLVFGTPTHLDQPDRLTFTLFNSDGSRAEVSGNGLACFGHAILQTLPGRRDLDVVVDTAAGPRRIRVKGTSTDVEVSATVEMGAADSGPDISRLVVDLGGPRVGRVASVDMGNPHLVVEVDDPDDVDLAVVGPALEAIFEPVGCNIHMVSVSDTSHLRLRTWERGAGLTEACGSGACAAAAAASGWGEIDETVQVLMPGGTTTVVIGDPMVLSVTSVFVDDHEVNNGW